MKKIRETMEQQFAVFETFLDEKVSTGIMPVGYEEACKICGVPAKELERYIYETLGVSGEILVKCYRTHTPVRLLM